jgi:leader peptidase (prepilin peptidase)/N-methyltransferase
VSDCYAAWMESFAALPGGLPLAAAGVLGLLIGSFLNVVIHRVPRGESVVHPPSHCPGCGRPVAPWENIPVLSYLWLRGRCRGCGVRISLRYPAIELATGLLFVLIVARHGLAPMTLVYLLFAAALVAAAAIDFDHRIIPDRISIGGLLAALVLVPAAQAASGQPLGGTLVRTLSGALLGGGLLWTVGFAHARVSVGMGRSFEHWPGDGEPHPRPGSLDYWTWFPGLGFGDVKLLAMIGAVLGPLGVLEALIAAALGGLVLGLGFAVATRRFDTPFGFAPALALGALLVVLAPADLRSLLG